jgi:hypothetical protein
MRHVLPHAHVTHHLCWQCANTATTATTTAMDMDADGKRWRALADYLIKQMAKRQQLLAAIVDRIRHC